LKSELLAAILLGMAATVSLATSSPTVPRAEDLLADVLTQLPADPTQIEGKLTVRRRRGVVVSEYGFEMNMRLGSRIPEATYVILDAFGSPLESLSIQHGPNHSNTLNYTKGVDHSPAPLSDLSQGIQNSDISWMDLTLSFLWWPGGTVIGEDSIKGFDCYIVEVEAPESSAGPYSRVRLWIAKKMHMMLQAEGYAGDRLVRRLWIRSCKKIDDRWLIKDMEIQQYPVRHRTKLRVLEVETHTP